MIKAFYNSIVVSGQDEREYKATFIVKDVSVENSLSSYQGYEILKIIKQGDRVFTSVEELHSFLKNNGVNYNIDLVKDLNFHHISPEFFDFHDHSELYTFKNPKLEAKRVQHVRGSIVGNCGLSVYPINKDSFDTLRTSVLSIVGEWPEDGGKPIFWSSLEEFKSLLKQRGVQNRLSFLTGHAALRIYALYLNPNREASDKEISLMCSKLEETFEQGSIGLSTGLYYAPCIFASRKELLSLLRVVAKHNKLFCVHIREEGNAFLESIDEVISLSKEAGCKLQISHLKAIGDKNQYKVDDALKKIDDAYKSGMYIHFDQYPYDYGSTSLFSILPPSVLMLPHNKLYSTIKDKNERKRIISEMKNPHGYESIYELCSFDKIFIKALGNTTEFNGLSINEISKKLSKDPFDTFFDLLLSSRDMAVMEDIVTTDDSVYKIFKHPLSIFASDSLYVGSSFHKRSTEASIKALSFAKEHNIDLSKAVYRMCGKGTALIDEDKYFTICQGNKVCLLDLDEFKAI